MISRENFRELLWPLPVDRMIFVGGLLQSGPGKAESADDWRSGPSGPGAFLEKKLGKQGAALSLYANGLDKSPVRSVYEEREVKSIGNSITLLNGT